MYRRVLGVVVVVLIGGVALLYAVRSQVPPTSVSPTASSTPIATPTPPATPSPAATATPSVVASPTPTRTPRASIDTEDHAERPLEALSADAAEYLQGRAGPIGVAVVVFGRSTIYTSNGDELFPMASVVKVAIMATVMDRAIKGGRELTDRERSLLEPMITRSDNDAARALWDELGGGSAVGAYLRSVGLTAIAPHQDEAWGASEAPAREVALLFAKLGGGEILNDEMRAYALDLLSRVVPDQRWGVTASIPDERQPETVIGIKDGWYPTAYGRWWVNSAGVVLPAAGKPAYAIAVLTKYQPTFDEAVETIESIASRVHGALHGPLPAGPP